MINKGDFLISTPESLGDYYFNRSIVILTEVNQDEIVGFIVNKELDYTLNDLDNSVLNKEIKIFSGGPVNQDNLYFIHRAPHKIDGSIHIVSDMYWGGNFGQVKKLINDEILSIDDIRFFLGYSGWNADQLKDELKNQSWIIDELEESLFDWDVLKLWEDRLCVKGNKYKLWVNAPKDISLN